MSTAADLGFTGTSPRALARDGLARERTGRDTGRAAPTAPLARRRPALALVAPARVDAPRAPFVAVVLAVLSCGLLGLLALNTVLAQDAFALHTITQDGRSLADREQSLSREVEALRSPQALAAAATELGMVQAGSPAFLRLPDGAILGAALPALAPGETRTESGKVVPAPQAVVPEAGVSQEEAADGARDSAGDSAGDSAVGSAGDSTKDSTDDEAPAEDDR